jgi:outer membrane lipoprotein carrier protein
MRPAVALCLAWAAVTVSAQQPTATAGDVAAALQRRYETIRDFSADFRHTSQGVLGPATVERGTLLVKKPGKMRWEYKAPEEKLFVTDGRTMYEYLPRDRQVYVRDAPQGDEGSTPVLFLSGRGNLARDFTASFAEAEADMPPDVRTLRLVPRTPQGEYEALVVTVDARTLALRGLTALDGQGGRSSFLFTNLRENVGVTDDRFTFTPPRGVEVFDESAR